MEDLYPSALAHLIRESYTQIHRDGVAPTGMRTAIISLLYKEKGERFNLQNYRSIAVDNAVEKILEKCMEICIRPLLPHLISPEQQAFQPDKKILENTQLVQDLIAYCNANSISRIILFCDQDQDNSYPRVKWNFILMVMGKMGIHVDFIRMIDIMYKDATFKMKVNSHVVEGFHPTNGVAQGSPLSPILYLLVIQSYISLLNISPNVESISVPGPGEDKNNCRSLKAGAFADNLNLFLRNTNQLTPFRALLAKYENASGAVNSWPKTFGLRLGTSGGPTSSQPDG